MLMVPEGRVGLANKDQPAWEECRKTLEKPEEMFVGWPNQKGTHFTICSATAEKPPPRGEPLEAVWFFRAASSKEANRAWYLRNGWAR
jgi:hypothetical protein